MGAENPCQQSQPLITNTRLRSAAQKRRWRGAPPGAVDARSHVRRSAVPLIEPSNISTSR